jgi:hypothetical protein
MDTEFGDGSDMTEGTWRAGTPPGGLHWSHGDATERSGDRESITRLIIDSPLPNNR